MEKAIETKNIIRNVVSEVLRECRNRHIRASAGFVAYYINLLQLDPNRGITFDCVTDREKIQDFVKYVVRMLMSKDDPNMLTLRLQHEFRTHIKELDKVVQHYRRRLSNKLYPLLLDIIEQDRNNTGEQLYYKMSYYVTLCSGLGNPAVKPVFKETLQVLRSILAKEEIQIFPSLQNYIKQELLGSLVEIITGIRLYNKSCKKGGEGMADLPSLLEKAIIVTRAELNNCIEKSLQKVRILTRSVERHMIIINRKSTEWDITLDFKNLEEKKDWEFRRDLLAAHIQLGKTTRILLESVNELNDHRIVLHEEFNEIVENLNKTIIPTLYQAVTDVFPHFTQLANIWREFQNDAVRLKEIFNIFKMQATQIFSLQFETTSETQITNFQIWVTSEPETLITNVANPNINVHDPIEGFTKKDLQFHGYCCWGLVSTGGALLPANTRLGVIEYKNQLYGFSSRMAANCFIRNPDSYIINTVDLARKSVHLIKLLDLEERLKEYTHIHTLIEEKNEPKIAISSQGVQTDTHIQESNIDYSHCWNIWEYKKTALMLADLKAKITKSPFTNKTYQKETNLTQTYEMKDSETQTYCDGYANTKKPFRFIYGLRGIRRNYPFTMDLTEPLSYSQVPKVVSQGKTLFLN